METSTSACLGLGWKAHSTTGNQHLKHSPDDSACGAHAKEPQRGSKLDPKYGPGFGANMGGLFEGRRAAPKRAKKSSDQQLGHIFGAAALVPYGGPLSGPALILHGGSPVRPATLMGWADKLTANPYYGRV